MDSDLCPARAIQIFQGCKVADLQLLIAGFQTFGCARIVYKKSQNVIIMKGFSPKKQKFFFQKNGILNSHRKV